MLKELTVSNYAIIEELAIEFLAGLNTITGETGAGKSILLGAMSLLAGARADTSVVRDPERNCVIEAVFDVSGYDMDDFFSRNELDSGKTITVRRVISSEGRSRAFIDDAPVNVATLRELSDNLIDIHSQHQTLLLAHGNFQVRIVDAVAAHQNVLDDYYSVYRELRSAEKLLEKLSDESGEAERRREYLTYQFDQISSLGLKPGEQEATEERLRVLANAEEIAQALGTAFVALSDDESGIETVLHSVLSGLSRIRGHYGGAEELYLRIESLSLELKDIADETYRQLDKIEINPAELTIIEERLDAIYTLCQKHGVQSAKELAALAQKMEEELSELESGRENIEELIKKTESLRVEAEKLVVKITANRKSAAPVIEKQVTATLKELGIKDAQFIIQISPEPVLTPAGKDKVTFLFSANKGVAPQPIDQVASGGEMSRLMLSLKNLVSQKLKMPTVIFDEIDTGVSGHVADRTGQIIASMGENMQVLNITHLPQVASKGAHHYFVYKDKGTHIRKLTDSERVEHIAMMLSGSNITEAARLQALELLNQNKK